MFLSCQDPYLLAGNFMADFISNKHLKNIRREILLGIELHKSIDSFTDTHKAVREAVTVLRPTQRKYSSVVADILFDFILTQEWHKYTDIDIEVFTSKTYQKLLGMKDEFPEKLMNLLPKMVDDDFLMSCKNEDRLIKTFERVGRRAKFDNNLNQAHIDMVNNYDVLQKSFHRLFPDLIIHVNQFCACQ